MAGRRVVVISLVERGWQAARECSLELQRSGLEIVHVMKGSVSPDVLALIAPIPSIRLVSVARSWFWPLAIGWVLWARWRGILRGVLVDNTRAQRRVGRCLAQTQIPVAVVQQGQAAMGWAPCASR